MVRAITYGRPIQAGSNSGRNVTISSTGREQTLSTTRPNVSRLVGSVQCASSKIMSKGFCRDNASTCAVSASSVFCLRCCGCQIERRITSVVRERTAFSNGPRWVHSRPG